MTAAAAPDRSGAHVDGAGLRVGFLGPIGTFTEQALLSQADLATADLVPLASMPDVLRATASGAVDLGFVAIENSIEGSVNVTVDALVFDVDLYIQREVVLPIQMNLMGLPGTRLDQVREVVSIPVATAQCREYLLVHLPDVVERATNSTVEAAQAVAKGGDPKVVAIAPTMAAELHGLEVLATDVEDHPDNATRFVLVRPGVVVAPTGHDKTSLVIFQRADRPGSLLAILQEFAARAINLTKLESRPTKRGLGDYCFIIDLEGHIADEVVADCLRNLKAKQADVKYLGSYPAAGEHGPAVRRDAEAAWQQANDWLDGLRNQVGGA